MPANLPSSFASAAAGQSATRDGRSGRTDGRGGVGGDWSRRDGRSANGTMTFRRTSTTPLGQPAQASPTDISNPAGSSEATVATPTNYDIGAARYSKDDLLDMFRSQKFSDDPSKLFISGWDPSHINGSSGRGWGKSNENHVPQEPGACWDQNGETFPLSLRDLSSEEREAFSTDINSPLKPPTQNKETHQGGINGRKASLSQSTGNMFGIASPSSATRPSTRRRETLESNPFSSGGLGSPVASGRFGRDEQPPWLPRKGDDVKEEAGEDSPLDLGTRDPLSKPHLPSLLRSNTAGSAGIGSLWASDVTTPGGGAFGNFSMAASSAIGDKRVGSSAGGSRLAHLIPKESSDSIGSKAEAGMPSSWRARPRTDTDPFGEEELSGSAVLGGSQDNPSGAASNRAGILGTPTKGTTEDLGMSSLNLGNRSGDSGRNSPSGTNPYRSPHTERYDQDDNTTEKTQNLVPGDATSSFNTLSRAFAPAPFDGSDRSQTSSVGAKGYPLHGVSGWLAPVHPAGTPDSQRPNYGSAFGNALFSHMNDLQTPGLGNMGNVFGPAGSTGLAAGSIGRGSKLGSLFPPAMQAQMQGHENDSSNDTASDVRQNNPLGAIGRGTFNAPSRDTESPMRTNRGVFEELFPSNDSGRNHASTFLGNDASQLPGTMPQSFTPVSGGFPFSGAQTSTDPLAAQIRQMVMPDRMRWVYLDPQGQVQGPFTGLEMNDWYKANFFTPDLRVKKVEDPEFEPLGQLIRRIGNSREPFLVPQIGVAHGPPSQTGPFNGGATGVVPPLSGVFPSFGRTLTAEEQNNLERRKQEEQYLMAQQRDFMMRQQVMTKFPLPGQGGLQHHSSAQSLQSQPSFGSMTNPLVSAHQAPGMAPAGFGDANHSGVRSAGGSTGLFGPDDLSNLSTSERQIIASIEGSDSGSRQPIGSSGEQGQRSGLPETAQLTDDSDGFKKRLSEFEGLRAEHDAQQTGATSRSARADNREIAEDGSLSLTEQVQITQAAAAAQPDEPGMPRPFPPPSSSTPLPAPTAQRFRSNLPEQYSRSQSGTPDAANPPPLAPWAKEPGHEGPRGPSLKEIQEAEARKAAKAEELAAAMRKAAIEQEDALLRERERAASAAASAAALPASSTWGHGSPVSASSPWTKPTAGKTVAPGLPIAPSNSKKTLAEIQREEEVRKQKARDSSTQPGGAVGGSKSYLNLVAKAGQIPGAASPVAGGAGWATVGAGGKVKGSTGPGAPVRSASVSSAKPVSAAAPAKPVLIPSSNVASSQAKTDNVSMATDEFNRWAHRELSRGITGVTDIASFQNALTVLPLDTGLIADAVYANSTTMDGRHFAEEYVRRKKLAEKGVIEKQGPTDIRANAASSGWSEVAKKGGSVQSPRDGDSGTIQTAGFKVVPSRKKGKK